LKIYIFQFAAYGDCLFATVVAAKLKVQYPNSQITWGIAKKYSNILDNNPHVNVIDIYDIDPKTASRKELTELVENRLETIEKSAYYDLFLKLQIFNYQILAFCTTLRHTIFRVNGITQNDLKSSIIYLNQKEISNVSNFIKEIKIANYEKVILFECSPTSGQSDINIEKAIDYASLIIKSNPNYAVILSSMEKRKVENSNLFFANSLTFRENLELLKYVDLLIGCSSGISWLTTCYSDFKKPIIQLLKRKSDIYCSMKYDFKLNELNHDHIIELYDYDKFLINEIIEDIKNNQLTDIDKKYTQYYGPTIYVLRTNLMRLKYGGFSFFDLIKYNRDFIKLNIHHVRKSDFRFVNILFSFLIIYYNFYKLGLKKLISS
jgi:ADP-heptose:LPS heptosyltransferase